MRLPRNNAGSDLSEAAKTEALGTAISFWCQRGGSARLPGRSAVEPINDRLAGVFRAPGHRRNRTGIDLAAESDRYFAKMLAGRHIGESLRRLFEREYSIYDGLLPMEGDRIDHHLEVLERADGNALKP
jgi:hypothetical protein